MIHFTRTTSDDPDFQRLVKKLDAELWHRYQEIQALYVAHNTVDNLDTAIVAYYNDKPVGCGCFKSYDAVTAELKRMFVEPALRGKKIGGSLVMELCNWAKELGFNRMILETGQKQPEAIRLYEKMGFKIIPNYEPYVGMEDSVCMEKV